LRRAALTALALIALATRASAWGTPDWVKSAAKTQIPAYPASTAGVVLLDETTTTVLDSGEIRTLHRRVYKILSTEGRDLGYASVGFNSIVQLVSFHAWSIAPSGDEWEVREREAIEGSVSEGILYADQKMKVIRIPAPDPGAIVAYEYETRERQPQMLQDSWPFQREIPVRNIRYTLVLPAGWTHDEKWFNAPPVTPQTSANQFVWELKDVPAIGEEIGRPSLAAVAGRMAVNFNKGSQQPRTWSDFGRWYAELASGRRTSTPALQAKVKELTNGKTTMLEKIAALASFAQHDIRYVAIEIGIGGYQPHPAEQIFSNRYGDCKDKVTALSTMLTEIGVESFYVITSTNRGVVDRQFASMEGFNHAVIAIRLPADAKSESLHAVMTHPQLGRILIFDPTSEMTAFGDIPDYLQQNEGLLVVDRAENRGGDLIEMPVQAPETTQLRRTARLALDASGVLSGTVREVRNGAMAANMRYELAARAESARIKFVESAVAAFIAEFKVSNVAFENLDDLTKDLVVTFTLAAPSYAKHAGPLVLVRPRVLGHKAGSLIDLKARVNRYETDGPSLQTDDIEITLPATLDVDELPEPRKVSIPSMTYASETKSDHGVLRYHRELRVQAFSVPLAGLAELNKAFAEIQADERSAAVLKEK
jgi:hypothetical protein